MDKKYKTGLMLGIVLVAVIALFDIISMNSGMFGTTDQYTNGVFGGDWWSLFLKLNLAIIVAFGAGYYFFYKKDLSETIGVIATPVILWFFGLSDVLFFWFQGKVVPSVLPWLNDSLIIGTVTSLLGFTTVTSLTLFVSIILGFAVSYGVAKLLWKVN